MYKGAQPTEAKMSDCEFSNLKLQPKAVFFSGQPASLTACFSPSSLSLSLSIYLHIYVMHACGKGALLEQEKTRLCPFPPKGQL